MRIILISLFYCLEIFSCTFICKAQEKDYDIVYVKGGYIIRGIIVKEVTNVYIRIKTDDNVIYQYYDDQIDSIRKAHAGISGVTTREEENRANGPIIGVVTIGFLQGGGSLIGVDFESPLSEHLAVQYGIGFIGAGAAIIYHFKPSQYRSCLALNYWHQGLGSSYTQGLLGPSYIWRPVEFLSLQIGMAYIVDKGVQFDEVYSGRQPKMILIYSLGISFPIQSKNPK